MENKPPKVLFQYRPTDKWAFDNLRQRILYLAPTSGLKDPYDCGIPPFLHDLTDEEHRAVISSNEHWQNYKNLPKSEFIRNFNKYAPETWLDIIRQKTGVACFSAYHNNLLMWSHYANGGRGFCLAFDTQKEDFFVNWTIPVTYSPNFPKINVNAFLAKDKRAIFRDLDSWKSKDWEYEKEWRLVGPAKYKATYAAKTLKAVYLGTEADDKTERKIRAIVKEKYPYTKIKRAYLSRRKYKVLFRRLP